MVTISIDKRKVETGEDATVLDAARAAGIDIPTLCDHPAVEPYGACRLCLVEIKSGGRTRLMTACTYPVSDGLEVTTDSERVLRARRFIIELLLARCPGSEEIRGLARRLGVGKARFAGADEKEKCILCGLCVRVCGELIGDAAIGFIRRGAARAVETPFGAASEACSGCGACAVVCPTGAVEIRDRGGTRRIETWHTERELVACAGCGERFASAEVLARLKGKLALPMEALDYCGKCRRKRAGGEARGALRGAE